MAPPPVAVLGIDLGSARWATSGSARLALDGARVRAVVPGAIAWPDVPLTPAAMADAIDGHARAHGARAVALDGPHAWRDPATPADAPGVGRRGEHALRTQGKTGARGSARPAYPRTQLGWTRFCVEVFDALLARPGVALAAPGAPPPDDGYLVLETFPTASWRAAGLPPLPAKARRPPLAPHVAALRGAFALPAFATASHDDLQAVVAALVAAALLGGPGRARAHGVPAATAVDAGGPHRVEGWVWDVAPPVSAAGAPCSG